MRDAKASYLHFRVINSGKTKLNEDQARAEVLFVRNAVAPNYSDPNRNCDAPDKRVSAEENDMAVRSSCIQCIRLAKTGCESIHQIVMMNFTNHFIYSAATEPFTLIFPMRASDLAVIVIVQGFNQSVSVHQ